jgi:hypothetical protein
MRQKLMRRLKCPRLKTIVKIKRLEKFTWKHANDVEQASWTGLVLNGSDMDPSDKIARIFRFDDAENSVIDIVFIVTENTDVVSCQSACYITRDSL